MNYLDYLSGDIAPELVPSNYVQPMGEVPMVVPQPAPVAPLPQPPTPAGTPGFSYGKTGIPVESSPLPSANLDALIKPTEKPMLGTEIQGAVNPYRNNPVVDVNMPLPNLGVTAKARSGGDMAEAQRAVDAMGMGRREARAISAKEPQRFGEYEKAAAGAMDAYNQLDGEIQKYESATDNVMNTYQEELAKYQGETDAIRKFHYEKAAGITKQINDLIDQKVDTTIDNGRFWSNLSTGNKVLLSIGMIFSAMTPESNKLAIDSLHKAIDRDIDAQKQTILNKMAERREKLTGSQAQLKNLYDMTENEQAAIETLRARQYQLAGLMVDQMSKKLSNKQALVNAETAKAQLQMQAITSRQNAINAVLDRQDKLADQAQQQRYQEAMVRLQKAKIASDEYIAGVRSQDGGAGFSGDILGYEIATRVPQKMQAEAIKERGIMEAGEAISKGLSDFYTTYNGWDEGKKIKAKIPGTDEYTFVNTAPVRLFNMATTIAKGALQKAEFDALMTPLMPSILDSTAAINTKKNTAIGEASKMVLEKTPTLRNYGIKTQVYFPNLYQANKK